MALCTSLAFMLPVSTPPNAIVYASGYVPITKMIKAAIVLTHLMLTATDAGLANMWIWDLNPSKIREVLPETREHGVYGLLAIGHPASGAGQPTELHAVRKSLDELVKVL